MWQMSTETADAVLRTCADAVLALDDGTRVPCSRFVMSRRCEVLRFIAEEDMPSERDANGRVVIPVPGMTADECNALVEVLHSDQNVENDQNVKNHDDARRVFNAARRLGVADVEATAAGAVWRSAFSVTQTLDVLPILLAGKTTTVSAESVLRAIVEEFPRWKDARRRVVAEVARHLDGRGVMKVSDLGTAYPPAAVATALLEDVPSTILQSPARVEERDTTVLMAAVTELSALMTPEEHAAVCGRLADRDDVSSDVRLLASGVVAAADRVRGVPVVDVNGRPAPFGSKILLGDDEQVLVVTAKFDTRAPPRRPVALDAAVRVTFPRHNTPFAVDVYPGRLVGAEDPAPQHLLVRVCVSRDGPAMLDPLWEGVFNEPVDGRRVVSLTMPSHDDPEFRCFQALARRTKKPVYVRIDVRRGVLAGLSWWEDPQWLYP